MAKNTKKLFLDRCLRQLDWLSNSLELNPIENLWNILKRRVERQVNKLIIKKISITIDIFQDIIRKKWEGIEPEIFINLIKSMPSRLEQIIKSNVNKINY